MNDKTPKASRKRGQRRSNIDLPEWFVDRITSDGLDFLYSPEPKKETPEDDILTLENLFKRYFSARQAQGAAERTLDDCEKHMRWFQRFLCSEYNDLDNFLPNREVIQAWISHMFTVQKLKPSTINIRLRTVKAMFNWGVKERILRESPFENVDLLRVPEEEFQVISPAQERRLFQACNLQTLVGLRDALLMSLLFETGVRIGECVRIRVDEVDLARHSITVRAQSTLR